MINVGALCADMRLAHTVYLNFSQTLLVSEAS